MSERTTKTHTTTETLVPVNAVIQLVTDLRASGTLKSYLLRNLNRIAATFGQPMSQQLPSSSSENRAPDALPFTELESALELKTPDNTINRGKRILAEIRNLRQRGSHPEVIYRDVTAGTRSMVDAVCEALFQKTYVSLDPEQQRQIRQNLLRNQIKVDLP